VSGFVPAITSFVEHYGYWAILLLMALESAGIPIASEIVMPLAGYFAQQGHLTVWGAVAAGTLANLIGSLVAYWVSRYGGVPLLVRYGRYIGFRQHHLEIAQRWFARYGVAAVFFSRMLPVVRTFISFPAGVGRVPLGPFILWTVLGAIPWNAALVYAGYVLGQHWEDVHQTLGHLTVPLAALLVLGVLVFLFWGNRQRTRRDEASPRY
jgi:membrane protein DedA with SNARE-associated domain